MRPARWKLTLIACAAASAGAGAQVTAPSDAGALPASPLPALEEAEAQPGSSWRLPPMRISGIVSYDMRATRSAGESPSIANVLTGTLSTSTFLYAPWLATVSGSLGLSSSITHASAGSTGFPVADVDANDRIRTRENFITGEGRVDLFPRSRFPAEVHFARQDSRVDTGLTSAIQFQRQNIGGSVRFRPESGLYNLLGAYDHREQSGIGFLSKQDQLSGAFGTQWKFNELQLDGSYSRARDIGLEDASRFTSLVARHAYTPSNALSVNSTANLTRTQDSGGNASDLQVLQLSSVGIYHPLQSPLTLTGTVRGLVLRDSPSDSSTDAMGATLGASYEVNPNLRLTANGGATATHTNGGNSTGFSGALGAAYQGDTIEFRGLHYDWFASGTVSGSTADSSTLGNVTDQSLGLQVGHSVGRTWRMSQLSTLGITASQSVSALHASSHGDTGDRPSLGTVNTLLNSVALTWQQSGDGRSGFARASYNDSMQLGGSDARFQLLNFQLSGNFDLGYGRSVTADLTYQRAIQRSSDLQASVDPLAPTVLRTRSSGIAGEVSFRQNQLFGVPRLAFVSRVRLAQDVLKQPGQLLSIPDRETRLWENRLDWNIGRLTTQMELRLSQIDGRRVDSLWLRIQRNFGD